MPTSGSCLIPTNALANVPDRLKAIEQVKGAEQRTLDIVEKLKVAVAAYMKALMAKH